MWAVRNIAVSAVLAGTGVAIGCARGTAANAPSASVDHTITYDAGPDSGSWLVQSVLAGIEPTDIVRLRLEDWGEWTERPGPYVLDLESDPPMRRDPDRATDYVLETPSDWNGSISVRYRIATVPLEEGHTLMPYRTAGHSLGFQRNTLMQLVRGDTAIPLTATLSLVPPDGWVAVSDLGAPAHGGSVQLTGESTSIVFGEPTDRALDLSGPRPTHCWQFGGDEPVCARTAGAVAQLLEAFGDLPYAAGRAPADTMTVLIPGGRRGGTGGVGGIVLGYHGNLADDPLPANITTLLAHELLHAFVQTVKTGDNVAVWFHEGFTEYLAQRYVVVAGMVAPNTFARQLQDKASAVAANPASNRVRFADPSIQWRDGDGPHERLAYDGGAVAAFAVDVESRLAGGGGVAELLRHLSALGVTEVPYDTVASWLLAAGLNDLRARLFEGTERYDVDTGLRRIGFAEGRRAAMLTYTGIETDAEVEPGRIVAIDPEGPAAGTELRVGDVIEDYGPKVSNTVHLPENYRTKTRYLFGFNRLARRGCCQLTARRGATRFAVDLNPWLSGGGWETGLVAERDDVAWFFR